MSQTMPLRIGDLVARNGAQVPGAPAASLGERVMTHGELNAHANRLARTLRRHGIGHGDRVLSWAGTDLEVMPLFAALAKLGAVFAPLNARHGIDEATPVARLARARLLICDAEHAEAAGALRERAGIEAIGCLSRGAAPGMLDLSRAALDADDSDVDEPALRETDPHVIFFTSGSTGAPKGVVLSHRANHLRTFQGVFLTEPERSVCMFPLFHMAGFTLALAAWQTRGEIALVESATAEEVLGAVQARRANRLYCIPAVWTRILETDPAAFDTSSLRLLDTGTSATPIELLQRIAARFPQAALRIFYGSTETGSVAVLGETEWRDKPGRVGLPSPGVDLRLGEGGEICVRSPYLMDGYFDAPEQTAEALRDGWLHTGDIGHLDEGGHLSIVGRLQELIRTGGESVAPAEVERALASHPSVGEVAVVGLPDPSWGEIVCAAVVPADGSAPSLSELQAHCDASLASFKKPRRLALVSELPRTAATGQVQRPLLVERLLAEAP
jgi:acyl-CoA synthetase (AMP-forming)/AMP-acid ligase II